MRSRQGQRSDEIGMLPAPRRESAVDRREASCGALVGVRDDTFRERCGRDPRLEVGVREASNGMVIDRV